MKIHSLTVIGSKAALVFDDTKPWAEKLLMFDFAIGEDKPFNRGEPMAIAVPQGEPLQAEMQRFADAITAQADPLSDAGEALYVQKIMARMAHALNRGADR